jgi:hypothetical protein
MWWRERRRERRQLSQPLLELLYKDNVAALLGAELAKQSEAFLQGRLAETVEEQLMVPVPVWVWTNLLAHGAEEELVLERANTRASRSPRHGDWRNARSYLAGQVLDLAATCGPLDELQRSVLVPLELELAAADEAASWTPNRWVERVQATLWQHRQMQRHRFH